MKLRSINKSFRTTNTSLRRRPKTCLKKTEREPPTVIYTDCMIGPLRVKSDESTANKSSNSSNWVKLVNLRNLSIDFSKNNKFVTEEGMASRIILFESTAQELEKQELEGTARLPLAELHCQLLSIYLCNFDLCNAKFLWKRISNEEKTSVPLLGQIWEVGQKLWLKEHNAVFRLIRNTKWPPSIKPYMNCLEENYRQKSLQLIGKAYLSITSTTFTDLVGYVDRPEEAEQLLAKLQQEQGWTCDSAAQLIIPKRPTTQNVPLMRNEDQLQSLTQFVSFLEN